MDNRTRFLQLLDLHDIKKKESAKIISAVTTVPCSDRAVRAWLTDPETPNARTCPDWAVKALEKGIGYMQQALAQRNAG